MTLLALLRHAPTAWNHTKRLQGRADIAITEEARGRMARRMVPPPYADWRALASPLGRCLQTASVLGLVVTADERLVEMDWGEYQGSTIDELRLRESDSFDANEHRGLDFKPPGGESPREVQTRLAPLLARLADPLATAHAEIAPDEASVGALGVEYLSNAPLTAGESARDALERLDLRGDGRHTMAAGHSGHDVESVVHVTSIPYGSMC